MLHGIFIDGRGEKFYVVGLSMGSEVLKAAEGESSGISCVCFNNAHKLGVVFGPFDCFIPSLQKIYGYRVGEACHRFI